MISKGRILSYQFVCLYFYRLLINQHPVAHARVLFTASATVVPCLTTVISSYGTAEQKGTVLGIFRSLGALARAGGPLFASTSEFTKCNVYILSIIFRE